MAYFQKREEEENNQNNNQNGGSFQTSSSEVGTNTSLMNDNSNRQNNISNQSGNWVNLNDYIKANEGKSGRYASNLVSNDLNKGDQYQSDLGNTKDAFGKTIRQDTAYNYGSDKSNKTAKNYYNDSSSVSDNELSTFSKASKGYQGQGEFNTYDGYDSLKDTSDYFSELTGGILDPTYRANNKMNANLNQGSKILNNLTLNSNTAQDTLKDASNQFSLISGELAKAEEEANKDRAGVVDIANANAKALKENQTKAETEAMAKLQASKNAADKSRQQKIAQSQQTPTYDAGTVFIREGDPISIGTFTGAGNSKFFTDNSVKDQNSYTNEQAELVQRGQDLLSGTRSSNSKLDLIQDTSSYNSQAAQQQQQQEQARANNLGNILRNVYLDELDWNVNRAGAIGTGEDVGKYVKEKITDLVANNKTVRDAMQSYVLGNFDENRLMDIIKGNIPNYDSSNFVDQAVKVGNQIGNVLADTINTVGKPIESGAKEVRRFFRRVF